MNYNEFAEKVKSKYPDYADMDNRELAQKMVAKFPDYSDVTFDEQPLGYQPSGLERAAEVSQRVQDVVMQGAGKMLQMAPYPIRKSAEAAGAIVAPIAQGIEAVGGYAAEKLGQAGVNPYVAGAVGTAAANAPYFALPGAKVGALPGTASAARRTLFNKQSILKKMPGGVPQAEAAGMEMLDKGVIGPFASKETMLGRATALKEAAGKKMEGVLAEIDAMTKSGVNAKEISRKVESDLMPVLSEGAFETDINTLDRILKTIEAGGSKTSFQVAQKIKEKLGKLGKFQRGVIADPEVAEKINMYRRSSGIMKEGIEKAVDKESPALASRYKSAKAEYGPAKMAEQGLSDAYITEAANVVPSLRGTISGAEAVGRGEFGRAAMLMAGYDLASRKGAQMAAYTLGKAIPDSLSLRPLQRAAYAQFITRITEK